jgi:glutathione S-transferase
MDFYYSPGACSIAAHIALEMTGADYQPHRVAIALEENLKPEFLAINPQGRVPTLVVNGEIIMELSAILHYLAAAHPQAKLIPADSMLFAKASSLMSFLASNVHISIATIWRPDRFFDQDADEASKAALANAGRKHLQAHLAAIESRLPASGWLCGQRSVADLMLLPFYRFGLRLDMDMTNFRKYTAYSRVSV